MLTESKKENSPKVKMQSFFHINYSSTFWGFVDDMSIGILDCQQFINSQDNKGSDNWLTAIGVQIQSQLRIGDYDFEVNPTRIAEFYECLHSRIDKSFISDKGGIGKMRLS